MRFDSKKEAARWAELFEMQRAGAIHSLRRQVRYPLRGAGGAVVARYVADAVYVENGRLVIEDTKSPFTRKLPVYRLKRKLMQDNHNIEIREV